MSILVQIWQLLFWSVEEDAIQLEVVVIAAVEVELHILCVDWWDLELKCVVSLSLEVQFKLSNLNHLVFGRVEVGHFDVSRVTRGAVVS